MKINLTRFGVFTSTIAILCVLVFIFSQLFGLESTFFYFGYPVNFKIENFEYLRLISPIFIHFSLLHLACNLCWWLYLGKKIEETQGIWVLLILTIFSALASNFMEYDDSHTPYFGGLSGVVFAVIGYVWLFGHLTAKTQQKTHRLFLPNEFFFFSLIWLIVGYFNFDLFGNIANMANLSGLICGLFFAIFYSFYFNLKVKFNSKR